MIVRAECEKCSHKWDLEMKPMETITCPNCKTVYDALIVVNDPENEKTMRIVRENRSRKMNKVTHNCDNINCNHNDTKGLCCLFNPENCKYRQLQKENAELKADNEARKFAMAMSEKVEKQLREENAELDCQKNRNKFCYSCANATEKCFKNEIGCPCDKYKSWKEENAELKENYFYERCIRSTCPYIHKVNRNCMAVGGFFTAVSNKDCPMMKNLNANVKLLNAKEIIERLRALYLSPVVTKEDVKRQDEILNEAEKFIKAVKK